MAAHQGGEFKSPQPTKLRLGGKYKVALQSIILTHKMYKSCVAEMIENHIFRYRLTEINDKQDFLGRVQLDVIEAEYEAELHFEVANDRATLNRSRIGMDENSPKEMTVNCNKQFYLACGDARLMLREIEVSPPCLLFCDGKYQVFA